MKSIKDQGLRRIGNGDESGLDKARTLHPNAPLFAVVEHHREWSDLRERWMIVSDVVVGNDLMDVAAKYDQAIGRTGLVLCGANVEKSAYTGYDKTAGYGMWGVDTHYRGDRHSGFVVGLAALPVLQSMAAGRYVDRTGNDIFQALMLELYPDHKN